MSSYAAELGPKGASTGNKDCGRRAFLEILYRATSVAVLLACVVFFSAIGTAQEPEETPQITPRDWSVKKKKDKGPRALGLLQLSSNGKATLIPIAIRVDGKFYDATAYKADPVPMALDSGVVYEGERTGNSVGLFTLNGALRSIAANNPHPWIGTGMWLPAGSEAARSGLKAEKVPVGIETTDEPPRLTRGENTAKDDSKAGTASTPASTSSKGSNPSAESQPKPEPPKPAQTAESKPPEKKETSSTGTETSRGDDTYRPRLRRGKPTAPLPEDEDVPGYSNPKKERSTDTAATPGTKPSAPSSQVVQLIPAISDAGGPDPRSFTFDWDKTEAENRLKQMLALASDQIGAYVVNQAKAKIVALPASQKTTAGRKRTEKLRQPVLENVQFRPFDLWANNQPVLVLTADAHMPPSANTAGSSADAMTYTITLVARTDIYSNLHALYTGITDKYHLDVTPRLDLIDAVDVDGDGRGELLFQETTDAGAGYVIYRATADKLWKMFDSLNPE